MDKEHIGAIVVKPEEKESKYRYRGGGGPSRCGGLVDTSGIQYETTEEAPRFHRPSSNVRRVLPQRSKEGEEPIRRLVSSGPVSLGTPCAINPRLAARRQAEAEAARAAQQVRELEKALRRTTEEGVHLPPNEQEDSTLQGEVIDTYLRNSRATFAQIARAHNTTPGFVQDVLHIVDPENVPARRVHSTDIHAALPGPPNETPAETKKEDCEMPKGQPTKKSYPTQEQEQRIVELNGQGMSDGDIASIVSKESTPVSRQGVTNCLKRNRRVSVCKTPDRHKGSRTPDKTPAPTASSAVPTDPRPAAPATPAAPPTAKPTKPRATEKVRSAKVGALAQSFRDRKPATIPEPVPTKPESHTDESARTVEGILSCIRGHLFELAELTDDDRVAAARAYGRAEEMLYLISHFFNKR